MIGYSFVTSVSLKGYEKYGRNLIESFAEHCNYPLTVYSENELPALHLDLRDDPDWCEFQSMWPDDGPDWKLQAKRFSHKVFAITHEPPDSGWQIWLDADVEVFGPLDRDFLASACPDYATLSYLGRTDMSASECGWVAYNMNRDGSEFLSRFREKYISGEVYEHLEWHDSYIFDRVREEFNGEYHNLSKDVPGLHVWDSTILGETMRHMKGPLRKKGIPLEGLPDNYRSEKECDTTS